MFSHIRHVAAVAVIALAAISFSHQAAKAQTVQLPQSIADQVADAMEAGTTDQILAALRAILDANPQLAGAIAARAGATTPALAEDIGTEAAQAVSASSLPDAQKVAQVQLAARGLAQANPAAAADILNTISASVTPDLQTAVIQIIAEVTPAAGQETPPPADPIVVVDVPDDEFTPHPDQR